MDTEFPLVREAHDTQKESLRDRNDEVLERIYIGRRFAQKITGRHRSAGKTL